MINTLKYLHLDWLSTKDLKILGALLHEPGEFVAQKTVQVVQLFYFDADAARVH